MADLGAFQRLARLMQMRWHGRGNGPTAGSGRLKMTFNIANLQQVVVSVVGAVLTATLFVSAAVGPVAQFV